MYIIRRENSECQSIIEFAFKRIRADKERKNSFAHANTIIGQYLDPILLHHITFKACDITKIAYRSPGYVTKNNFAKMSYIIESKIFYMIHLEGIP